MVALIERLEARGHTYTADGSVYFRIASFPEYGGLSRLDVSGIKTGARVDTDKYEKEDARDFVLWKLKGDEPAWAQWDAPFGRGRPGWHIECSAMSMKYLGETFDIHCGGVDLIFPHHENEIAQSECGTGKLFARHWMHVEHLLVENETMSKSKGNVYTIPDLLAKGLPARRDPLPARAARTTASRSTSPGGPHQAERRSSASTPRGPAGRGEREGPAAPSGRPSRPAPRPGAAFDAALADDLNTPEALAAVHGLVSRANTLLAEGALTRAGAARVRAELRRMDSGLRRPARPRRRRPPLGGGAGAVRRAAGGAATARFRPRRCGANGARGARRRHRGHPQGHAVAADAVSALAPGSRSGPAPRATRGRAGLRAPARPRLRDPRPELPVPGGRDRHRGPGRGDASSSWRSRSAAASRTARPSRR